MNRAAASLRTIPVYTTADAAAGSDDSRQHYNVHLGRGLLDNVADLVDVGSHVFLLTQEPAEPYARRVQAALHEAGCDVAIRIVPDAEAGKTPTVMFEHWQWLAEHGAGRDATIIGVGGGACTDAAGFLAATWMRGVRFVAIPTTVAGMVDAAVGGKTGINLPQGKNLVGAFWSPHCVVSDLDTLRTVPQPDVRAGLAEVVKCGFIADTSIIDVFEADLAADGVPSATVDTGSDVFEEVVAKSVAVKAHVVGADFRESGAREALNFGHTLGHAIEKVESYTWRHGDAVSVGMLFAAQLQRQRQDSGQARDVEQRLRRILAGLDLPLTYNGSFEPLMDAMKLDKKNRGKGPRFVLVPSMGETTRWDEVPGAALQTSYGAIRS